MAANRPIIRLRLFDLAMIALLVCIAYSNTLHCPFVFDDVQNITRNRHIQLGQFSGKQLWAAGFRSPLCSRPVANLSFALNYYVGGYDTTGYHAVNIAIHLFNGILVYWLVLLTLRRFHKSQRAVDEWPDDHSKRLIALLAALLFALHPIQTQSVTYIVQRMNSLAVLFYLLALTLYVHGRLSPKARLRWLMWGIGLISWGLSLGCKQITVTLPLVVFLYEWYFFRELSWRWLRRSLPAIAAIALCMALVGAIYLLPRNVFGHYENRDFTPAERVLTQFRVVWIYAGLVFLPLPSRFNLLHYVSTSQSLLDPVTTLVSLFAIILYLVLAVWIARRNRLISFCLFWPVVHLALESSILPLEMVYEHRMYLPLVGLALLVSYGIVGTFRRRLLWAGLLASILVVCLACATHTRNATWRDPLIFWSDVIEKNPQSARAFTNRGEAFAASSEWELAIADHTTATQRDPRLAVAYYNRGYAQASLGRHQIAIDDYTMAMQLAEGEALRALARGNRGVSYSAIGRPDMAIADFTIAIDLEPEFVTAIYNRGNAYRVRGQFAEAIGDYTLTTELAPEYHAAHNNLAFLLSACPVQELRDAKRALHHARRSCELTDWKDWNSLDTLALAQAVSGNLAEAIKWQIRSIKLAPKGRQPDLHHRLQQYRAARLTGD